MEAEILKKHMINYDFINNSIKNFCNIYGCSEKYVYNKIREYNIPYKKKGVKVNLNRDRFGRFTFKNLNLTVKKNEPETLINNNVSENSSYCLFKKHVPLDEKIKKILR